MGIVLDVRRQKISMNLQARIRYVISVLTIKKKKQYYINKRDGIEIVKEPKIKFEV